MKSRTAVVETSSPHPVINTSLSPDHLKRIQDIMKRASMESQPEYIMQRASMESQPAAVRTRSPPPAGVPRVPASHLITALPSDPLKNIFKFLPASHLFVAPVCR
eukprot:CAMPEP_0194273128 /NCGR_PEP_ID=MMETSP0169-20130528/6538_1 /TAXON_ID=218684 /ORGANISM="Corethron pennatum, Strain L29A3" /LENGTH=104 /DNA_ID=CAMNT_0039015987 /DNA_START=19 /DNA_END=329 /DNA_ORIENTATION=+